MTPYLMHNSNGICHCTHKSFLVVLASNETSASKPVKRNIRNMLCCIINR
ncbi:hypothetical protein Hanom_Chr12g01151141 [Helianthus anomalus]